MTEISLSLSPSLSPSASRSIDMTNDKRKETKTYNEIDTCNRGVRKYVALPHVR